MEETHRAIGPIGNVHHIARGHVTNALRLLEALQRQKQGALLEIDDTHGVVLELGHKESLPREIDGQMVVFNSRYLEYADVAISDYWRAARVKLVDTHVVKATVEFRAPLRYYDDVAMYVRTDRIGNSSITTTIEMCHAESGDVRAIVELVHVHVDLTTGRPVPIPAAVRDRLTAFDAETIRQP